MNKIPWSYKVFIPGKWIHSALLCQIYERIRIPGLCGIVKNIPVVPVILIETYP